VFAEAFFVFNSDNMLRLNKKDLVAMAKKMKVVSHSSPGKELKMKAVVASNDEDTCLGLVFKRRRKTAPQPTKHSASDGRAPSQRFPIPNPSPT